MAFWKPTVIWSAPASGQIICARFPPARRRTLPLAWTWIFTRSRPLPSSSRQLPHISAGAAFGTRHVLVWTHTPPMQASVVQALKSLQLATVVQGVQPLMAAWWQTPASQVSVVQALWSSQSRSVVQQPEMAVLWHTPATHDSMVQALLSLQSAAVAQGLQSSSHVFEQT